jgi:hypothetical protein
MYAWLNSKTGGAWRLGGRLEALRLWPISFGEIRFGVLALSLEPRQRPCNIGRMNAELTLFMLAVEGFLMYVPLNSKTGGDWRLGTECWMATLRRGVEILESWKRLLRFAAGVLARQAAFFGAKLCKDALGREKKVKLLVPWC